MEGTSSPKSASSHRAHQDANTPPNPKKRSTPTPDAENVKVTKRRAARACVSCRARKVRCDVVEGAPCGNCRWDNVECIVQESRRRKKHLPTASLGVGASGRNPSITPTESQLYQPPLRSKDPADNNSTLYNAGGRASESEVMRQSSVSTCHRDTDMMGSLAGDDTDGLDSLYYQQRPANATTASLSQRDPTLLSRPPTAQHQLRSPNQDNRLAEPRFALWNSHLDQQSMFEDGRTLQFLNSLDEADASAQLPGFVRPLPRRIDAEDVKYLRAKGALDFPSISLQTALLHSYVEYVHPYMPLLSLQDFLSIVSRRDGLNGQTSLLLYQAVLFSATAFVHIKHLREAGYPTRKMARKAFFQKTRLLYDLDYESDRLILVQSLMHMTFWYETPDDQKDTWHWMGVAISLAHTIGLHRNPETTSMAPAKQKLWKRIWWSCFMRDRLVALGMRRPTRIKDEDFDVPMLDINDFEIAALSENNNVLPPSCTLMRDTEMQRDLAYMCIAKAKLCMSISHMLKAQYSVLIRDNVKPDNTTNSTMMLFPNKTLDNVEGVIAVDQELAAWAQSLPEPCKYRSIISEDMKGGRTVMVVQRTLLHMVYYTTVSALHRPQFLPSSPHQAPTTSRQVQEMSRVKVRGAAAHITRMATQLHQFRLERYLPTSGVTVILPAMIIHLLEMKSPDPQARDRAIHGFKQCKKVMEKLREAYSAADYATGFLDAALRKAAINIHTDEAPPMVVLKHVPVEFSAQTPPPENAPYMTATESLFNSERAASLKRAAAFPPPGPNTASPADLELSTTQSPPRTDLDSVNEESTPRTSGASASDGQGLDPLESLDLDFMQDHDEFDWNAIAGTDFDVDQYLQFPQDNIAADTVESNKVGETKQQAAAGLNMDWVTVGDGR